MHTVYLECACAVCIHTLRIYALPIMFAGEIHDRRQFMTAGQFMREAQFICCPPVGLCPPPSPAREGQNMRHRINSFAAEDGTRGKRAFCLCDEADSRSSAALCVLGAFFLPVSLLRYLTGRRGRRPLQHDRKEAYTPFRKNGTGLLTADRRGDGDARPDARRLLCNEAWYAREARDLPL